jgi:hypothetical protein
VKVIPDANLDPVMSIGADFPTIEKYKNNFSFTIFGVGAQPTDTNPAFSGVDLSSVKGGLIVVVNNGASPGIAEQAAIPAPFAAALDIVVSPSQGFSGDSHDGAGDITMQVVVKKFIGPSTTDDQGVFYDNLLRAGYRNFLSGEDSIENTRDFTKESDFTDNSDFSTFSESFGSLASLPK